MCLSIAIDIPKNVKKYGFGIKGVQGDGETSLGL